MSETGKITFTYPETGKKFTGTRITASTPLLNLNLNYEKLQWQMYAFFLK